MPPGGAEDRGKQLATLGTPGPRHASPPEEVGRLLEDLAADAGQLDRRLRRSLPGPRVQPRIRKSTACRAWVAEFAQVTTRAQEAWEKARAKIEFLRLPAAPRARSLNCAGSMSAIFPPTTMSTIPLLDDFEPGMKTAEVKAIFNACARSRWS